MLNSIWMILPHEIKIPRFDRFLIERVFAVEVEDLERVWVTLGREGEVDVGSRGSE